MSPYLIFSMGVFCGFMLGLFVLGMCRMCVDHYSYRNESRTEEAPMIAIK